MHILADRYRSEFLATPQLVRIDLARGSSGLEPTLLVKGSTLLLKYVVLGARLQFQLGRINDRLLYAFTTFDDLEHPVQLWSVVENDTEVAALKGLVSGESCKTFLFNELALNVAWSTVNIVLPPHVQTWIGDAALGPVDYPEISKCASVVLENGFRGTAPSDVYASVQIELIGGWQPIFNHLVTSHGVDSPIDLFSRDEGGQQEQLAVWLTDSLNRRRVHHSPQVPNAKGYRELTDILLSYEHGTFLIESKTLTIFNRGSLPQRAKLAKDVSQHVDKAVRQLRGSIRRLKNSAPVSTRSGVPIEVERSKPMHAIVLVPEFSLIENRARYGREFIADFMAETGGFIHLLDISELLRIVQAAEIIARRSSKTTPLMAFDYYLMERAKLTREAGTLCIQVLLKAKP